MVKRKRKTAEELAASMKEVLKGKELNPDGGKLFDEVLKQAVKPKKRGSK